MDGPGLSPEEKGRIFEEIMRRVRAHTPEQQALIMAEVELIEAQHRIEGELYAQDTVDPAE